MDKINKEILTEFIREYAIRTGGRDLENDIINNSEIEIKGRPPSLRKIEKAVCSIFDCDNLVPHKKKGVSVVSARKYFCLIAMNYYSSNIIGKYIGVQGTTVRCARLKFKHHPDHLQTTKLILHKLNEVQTNNKNNRSSGNGVRRKEYR